MTPLGTGPAEYAPIFDWTAGRRRKVSLISFLVASAFLHALCFYVFQIIYPPTVALLPPPARVNLITGDTEAGRLLWGWIEAEDPALSSTTQRPAEAAYSLPPEPAHVPSYAGYRPALKQPPPFEVDLGVPSAQPPGPVRVQSSPRAAQPPVAVTTRVTFAGEAAWLAKPEIPPGKLTASNDEPPAAAQFHVAIDDRGAIRHCFLESSSGDPALDENARRVLLLSRFPEMPPQLVPKNQLLWTAAVFEWGNDVAVSPATSPEPAP